MGDVKAQLTKKIHGIPVWALALGTAILLGLAYYIIKKRSGTTSANATPTAAQTSGADTSGGGSGGNSSGDALPNTVPWWISQTQPFTTAPEPDPLTPAGDPAPITVTGTQPTTDVISPGSKPAPADTSTPAPSSTSSVAPGVTVVPAGDIPQPGRASIPAETPADSLPIVVPAGVTKTQKVLPAIVPVVKLDKGQTVKASSLTRSITARGKGGGL